MTPEEIKTIQNIEQGLADIKKGTATRDELLKYIDERTANDKAALAAAQQELTAIRSQAEEIKAASDLLQTQFRRIQANGYSSVKDGSGNYRGVFSCAEEAKTFGLMMLAGGLATCQQNAGLSALYSRVLKAIEKAGQEPVYVNEGTGQRIEKAATTGSQASGSLLVTSEMSPSMIKLFERYGVFESEAARVPMGAASTFTPKTDTLLTLYVPGEGTAPTVTDPTIGGVNLIPKSILGLMAYSMELDEDSAIAMAELYGPLIAMSYAYYVDMCGLLGDGTSTYFGFRGIAGAMRAVDATIANIQSVVVGSGNAYSELVYGDFEACVGKLPTYADPEDNDAMQSEAKWLMHRYFYYTVFVRAALAAGTGHAQEVILGTAQRQKLAVGYPVRFAQVMPRAEANSQHCATFGNLKLGCQLGVRGVMEFAQSDQRYFNERLIALRSRRRLAINAHGVGDTTKAGPLIGLYTAAS